MRIANFSSLSTEVYDPQGLHPSRGVAASEFPPLRNIPHCCLPQESGPCLSSSVADHPLRSATHRRLGEPLPHQLSNGMKAHLMAFDCSKFNNCFMQNYCTIGFQSRFRGVIPVRKVGCLHITHPCAGLLKILLPYSPRLACVRHAASVRPEPGSNSPL